MLDLVAFFVTAFLDLEQPQMAFKYALQFFSKKSGIDYKADKAFPNFSNSLKGVANRKFSDPPFFLPYRNFAHFLKQLTQFLCFMHT